MSFDYVEDCVMEENAVTLVSGCDTKKGGDDMSKMISFARLQVGKPYVFGASGLGNTLNDQVRNLALRVVPR